MFLFYTYIYKFKRKVIKIKSNIIQVDRQINLHFFKLNNELDKPIHVYLHNFIQCVLPY